MSQVQRWRNWERWLLIAPALLAVVFGLAGPASQRGMGIQAEVYATMGFGAVGFVVGSPAAVFLGHRAAGEFTHVWARLSSSLLFCLAILAGNFVLLFVAYILWP